MNGVAPFRTTLTPASRARVATESGGNSAVRVPPCAETFTAVLLRCALVISYTQKVVVRTHLSPSVRSREGSTFTIWGDIRRPVCRPGGWITFSRGLAIAERTGLRGQASRVQRLPYPAPRS